MKADRTRPYLTDRRCGRCFTRFETRERWEGDWLMVDFKCPGCGASYVVSFGPAEISEWERRRLAKGRRADFRNPSQREVCFGKRQGAGAAARE